jgi:sporulation protein YlmC with PRC-barrel domain
MDEFPLQLGAPVRCADGELLSLADIVIDPATRRLTHLVVDTGDGQTRLVPVERVARDETQRREVVLTCSAAEVRSSDAVREVAYVGFDAYPDIEDRADIGVQDTLVLPSPGSAELGGYAAEGDATIGVTFDHIPSGGAELRRESAVLAADGEEVGQVDGFLVRDGKVTHVVMQHGHLWGKRAVTIPIEAVEQIATDAVTLSLTRREIGKLPSVRS